MGYDLIGDERRLFIGMNGLHWLMGDEGDGDE